MTHSSGDIPSFIFDWLNSQSFASLSQAQQNQVLQHLTAEDYDELHESITGIKSVQAQTGGARKEAIKQNLLQKFDSKHAVTAKKSIPFFLKPVTLWKAAAVFVCVASGWLYTYMAQHRQLVTMSLAGTIDTLYITKEIAAAPVKILDTIYLQQENIQNTVSKIYTGQTRRRPSSPELMAAAVSGELNIVPVSAFDNTVNRQKQNSIKDDSLIKKYAFTTL